MAHEQAGLEGLDIIPKEGRISELFKSIADLKGKGKITAREIEDSFYGYARQYFTALSNSAVRDIKPTYRDLNGKNQDILFTVQIALLRGDYFERTFTLQLTPIKRMGKDAYGCRWMAREVIANRRVLGDAIPPRQRRAAQVPAENAAPAAEAIITDIWSEAYERGVQPRENGRLYAFNFRGYVNEARPEFKNGRFYRDTLVISGEWHDKKQTGVYVALDGINGHSAGDHFNVRTENDITDYHLHIELPPELEKKIKIKAQGDTFVHFDPEENPPKRAGVFARELPFDPKQDPLASERARYVVWAIRYYLRNNGSPIDLPLFIQERCQEAAVFDREKLTAVSSIKNAPDSWLIKTTIELNDDDLAQTVVKAPAPDAATKHTLPAPTDKIPGQKPGNRKRTKPTLTAPVPPETIGKQTIESAAPNARPTVENTQREEPEAAEIVTSIAIETPDQAVLPVPKITEPTASAPIEKLDQLIKPRARTSRPLAADQKAATKALRLEEERKAKQKTGKIVLAKLLNRYFEERVGLLVGEMVRVANSHELTLVDRAAVFDAAISKLLPAEERPQILAAWLEKMDIITLFKFSLTIANAQDVGERLAVTTVSELQPHLKMLRQVIDAEQKRRGHTF